LKEDGRLTVDGGGLGAIVRRQGSVAGSGAGDLAGVVAPVEAGVGSAFA
jgi:hypothetical protein